MINFFINNLDSFIISTIFLLLGFLPTFIDYIKLKKEDKRTSTKPINIDNNGPVINSFNNNNNLVNSYNYNENNYNSKTIVINNNNNSNSILTSEADDPWYIIILAVIFIFFMILFYRHIDRLIIFFLTITVVSLLISILIYKTILNISNYISVQHNIINMSVRNIICWFLLLMNYIVVVYKINFSSSMMPLMDLIETSKTSIDSEIFLSIYRFMLDNTFESFTGVFIIFSFLVSIYLIYKLLLSYILIISTAKVSINPDKRLWIKTYNSLNKKESKLNKKWWMWAFVILFCLSTGILAYLLSFPITMFQPHKS